jgi:hypothetical protein
MYKTTDLLHIALANNYIGEILIEPIMLSSLIHKIFTGKSLGSFTMYFYGKPDDELKFLFGYER